MTPLPRPRSHHAAVVASGHLYVLGGLDGRAGGHQAAFVDVLRAPIREDGTLGGWQVVSMLPHSVATHSAVFHEGSIWVLGGVEDLQRFTDRIWQAPLQPNGFPGRWEAVEPALPVARGHVHVTPVAAGRVYTAGGRIDTTDGRPGVTAQSHIGQIADPPR